MNNEGPILFSLTCDGGQGEGRPAAKNVMILDHGLKKRGKSKKEKGKGKQANIAGLNVKHL